MTGNNFMVSNTCLKSINNRFVKQQVFNIFTTFEQFLTQLRFFFHHVYCISIFPPLSLHSLSTGQRVLTMTDNKIRHDRLTKFDNIFKRITIEKFEYFSKNVPFWDNQYTI